MTEEKLRWQASITEVVRQRDEALARCANFAGDLAAAQAQISELQTAAAEALQRAENSATDAHSALASPLPSASMFPGSLR